MSAAVFSMGMPILFANKEFPIDRTSRLRTGLLCAVLESFSDQTSDYVLLEPFNLRRFKT